MRISSENHRKVFIYKMPTASTDSLLASALTKVKHRNSEMVKRDVLTTLHHYRGTLHKNDSIQASTEILDFNL